MFFQKSASDFVRKVSFATFRAPSFTRSRRAMILCWFSAGILIAAATSSNAALLSTAFLSPEFHSAEETSTNSATTSLTTTATADEHLLNPDFPKADLPNAEFPSAEFSRAEFPSEGPTTSIVKFSWPLKPAPAVAKPFQAPNQTYGRGHRGVDLEAKAGQDVFAAGSGTVVFAGVLIDRGVVSVDHGNGLRTTYEPISPSVHAGDAVFVGQVIGTVANGHSGCPATTCLHWGVKKAAEAEALPDSYLDPLTFMATASAIRLKPWEGEQSHR